MKKEESIQLTDTDRALMLEYLKEFDDIMQRKPEPVQDDIWDIVIQEIHTSGQVPAEYRDVIGVEEEIPEPNEKDIIRHVRFYDIKGERWNNELAQFNNKYHDLLVKVIKHTISNKPDQAAQDVITLLQQVIDENISLPAVIARKLENIDYPIDKVNKDIWSLFEYAKDSQLTYKKYNVAQKNSKQTIDVLYCIDFSSLENVSITRKLEPIDKRIYLAIAALFNMGYEVMSIQQIYNGMGYKGRAGATDIKKINTAISKMNGAHIFIDNLAEHNAYKYDHFKYDGSLLPMERIQAIINGQTAEAAIHIFREPPMVSFARKRKQITTVDIKVLDTPLNKTNANIELEDYLIEEIARIKKGSRSNKMLYKTIYENTNIKTVKQKQRAPEKIKQLLDHYADCHYIKAYEQKKDGISITY